ncbi:unnamed protein product [Amoebophrya sp. A120]|nr:unnamed protein product [Amoebophrya sp. A120]|eukprot:GSA120T00004289001.1
MKRSCSDKNIRMDGEERVALLLELEDEDEENEKDKRRCRASISKSPFFSPPGVEPQQAETVDNSKIQQICAMHVAAAGAGARNKIEEELVRVEVTCGGEDVPLLEEALRQHDYSIDLSALEREKVEGLPHLPLGEGEGGQDNVEERQSGKTKSKIKTKAKLGGGTKNPTTARTRGCTALGDHDERSQEDLLIVRPSTKGKTTTTSPAAGSRSCKTSTGAALLALLFGILLLAVGLVVSAWHTEHRHEQLLQLQSEQASSVDTQVQRQLQATQESNASQFASLLTQIQATEELIDARGGEWSNELASLRTTLQGLRRIVDQGATNLSARIETVQTELQQTVENVHTALENSMAEHAGNTNARFDTVRNDIAAVLTATSDLREDQLRLGDTLLGQGADLESRIAEGTASLAAGLETVRGEIAQMGTDQGARVDILVDRLQDQDDTLLRRHEHLAESVQSLSGGHETLLQGQNNLSENVNRFLQRVETLVNDGGHRRN